jgi:predicted ATP-dependent protease
MDMNRIAFALFAGLLVGSVAAAPTENAAPSPKNEPAVEEHKTPPPPGRHRPRAERRFRNGPGMWQVFSQLSAEERREMQKLQREDPEKFMELMRQKADELFRKREQRRAELRKLAAQCRDAAAPEERERLKKQLTEEVKKDFLAHLKSNRAQLEDMKRRTERLEKELQRREKNIDKAVEVHVDALIQGKKPPRRPDSRRFNREPLEK